MDTVVALVALIMCVFGGWMKGALVILFLFALTVLAYNVYPPAASIVQGITGLVGGGMLVVSFCSGVGNALRR